MKITTYTPFQLRTSSDLDLVDDIINVINEAYHTVQPTEKRIKSTKGFYTYLGDTGLVAALGDETTGQVVACVSVKAWGEEAHNYELFGVACLPRPQYIKRGLVDLCTKTLERELLAQTPKDKQLKFWVRVVEHVNGPYWRRKGFVEVERQTMEYGHWGYACVWEMVTMEKVIGRTRADA